MYLFMCGKTFATNYTSDRSAVSSITDSIRSGEKPRRLSILHVHGVTVAAPLLLNVGDLVPF